eukprot:m.93280 g.93280  ORF g.93280 m.93280 type:complete len:94 (+) comp13396_c0_seq3:2570-2851(+)
MVLRNTAHEKLYLSGGRENKIHTALHDLKKECASFGNDFQSDIERIKSIVTRIHRVESLISQADALMHKFGKKVIATRLNTRISFGGIVRKIE